MVIRLTALAAILFFLTPAFRSGWRRAETDIPNYYTAAVASKVIIFACERGRGIGLASLYPAKIGEP